MFLNKFKVILATDIKNGIGRNNKIPWNIKEDMDFFTKSTKGNGKNAVIMGSNTWKSLPKKYKPLPNRYNFILNNGVFNLDYYYTKTYFYNKVKYISECISNLDIDDIYVIGGAKIYNLFLSKYYKNCTDLYITKIYKNYNCDTFVDYNLFTNLKHLNNKKVIKEFKTSKNVRCEIIHFNRIPL